MGGISDLLADLSAGMYDDDPEFMEAVGWDESDMLHQDVRRDRTQRAETFGQ